MALAPFRFALRNLRQGLSGFRIFLICIVLGVTAIVGIDSLARSLADGLSAEGRTLLGADLVISRMHREATETEQDLFKSKGIITEVISLRGMARTESAAALVDIKAIEQTYPLLGMPTLDPTMTIGDALSKRGYRFGVVADDALFTRLGLKPGDLITLGTAQFELRAILKAEPDRIGGGLTLGPRLLMSAEALKTTGFIQAESLIRYSYRLLLSDRSDITLTQIETDLTRALADDGYEVRSRLNASPQLTRNIERFSQFLVLIGLTALVIGGTGVANAVSNYVERQRTTMAVFKALGASGSTVFQIAFIEIMILAFLGTVLGLVFGATLPYLVATLASSFLPFQLAPQIYSDRLILGALYGILTAVCFSLPALGRVHDLPVAALFRDDIAPSATSLRRSYRLATVISAIGLAATIIIVSHDRLITIVAIAGTLTAFGLLRLVSLAIMATAKRLRHLHQTELRLALGNIYRPGSLTPTLTLALGLGVTLLVAISAVQSNLVHLVTAGLPAKAPSFFFVDIPARDRDAFDTFLKTQEPRAALVHVPMLRGRITALNDIKANDVKASEDAKWVLDGDRGITFSETIPNGSRLIAGEWWPADYAGPPVVSLEADIAKGLGLSIGDTIAVNSLGRTIRAKIANLRRVDWQSLGINFVMVFSPNTFKGAPVNYLATLTVEGSGQTATEEASLLVSTARAFPSVTAIRVREALETVHTLLDQLALAIRGAAGVTLVASVFVLAGAVGAGQRGRIRDAVILKTLGATRPRLIAIFLLEFGILSASAGFFGMIAGLSAAWGIIHFAMRTAFEIPVMEALATTLTAAMATIGLGLLGTWRVLNEKPARHLRNP